MSTFTRIPFAGIEQRRNLVLNPPILHGVGTVEAGPNVTLSNDGGRVRVTHNNGAGPGNAYFVMPTAALTNGAQYSALVQIEKRAGTVPAPQVTIRDGFASIAGLTVVDGGSMWVASGTFTVPAPMGDPQIIVDLQGSGTGEAVRANATVEAGATIPTDIFDGSAPSPDPAQYQYSWTGAAYQSASIFSIVNPAVDQITPDLVSAPWTAEGETRTIRRALLQSEAVRVTFVPPEPDTGELDLVFADAAAAKAARAFFRQRREYYLDEPTLPEVATRFIVAGGRIGIHQDDTLPEQVWHVTIPWQEFPA